MQIKFISTMEYALITGGSRGIGKAIAVKLASQGLPVLINFRSNTEAAQQTQQCIEQNGGKCELLQFDIKDPKAIDEALGDWEAKHPNDYISVLVNNAGIRRDNVLVLMEDAEWHDVIDTPLNGFFYITRRVLKNMLIHRHGHIINMASLSGLKGLPGQTNYSAAKAAIIGATKALAQEVAKRHVTVNAIAPGFIATDMTKDLNESELSKQIPMGRFGKPEEVAALAAFLASDDSSYITGQVIQINGGLYT